MNKIKKTWLLVGGLGFMLVVAGWQYRQILQQTESQAKVYVAGTRKDTCGLIDYGADEHTSCPLISGGQTNNISTYAGQYRIANMPDDGVVHSVLYRLYTCFCEEPYGQSQPGGGGDGDGIVCNSNCVKVMEAQSTIADGDQIVPQFSRSSTTGQACGSYQTDLYIDAVDGNPNCHGQYAPTAASICQTGIACQAASSSPSPSPSPSVSPGPSPSPSPSPSPAPSVSPSPQPSASPLPPGHAGLVIRKFKDDDQDGNWDNNESSTGQEWHFQYRISSDPWQDYYTSSNTGWGGVVDISKGTKVEVKEVEQSGWTNTTGLTIIKILDEEKTYYFDFGNFKAPAVTEAETPVQAPETGLSSQWQMWAGLATLGIALQFLAIML